MLELRSNSENIKGKSMTYCPICNGNLEFTTKKVTYSYKKNTKDINQSGAYCTRCGESFLSVKDLKSTHKDILN
jgi:YgiT-type zinc finger domain-containing protein